jgi:hypothetical protein
MHLVMTPLLPLAAAAVLAVPSLHVAPSPVSRGASVALRGNAASCGPGSTVSISSRAFAGAGFAGLGGASTRVRADGSFTARARVAAGVRPGTYPVSARCGGANLGTTAHVGVVGGPTEAVLLKPGGGSTIRGRIEYLGQAHGTVVRVHLVGAPAGTDLRLLLQAGTCARHGASFAPAATGRTSAGGTFSTQSRIRFHGSDVPVETIADGAHVFVLVVGARQAACAVVPGIS